MSTRQDAQRGAPIASRDELVRYLEEGCKPPAEWRIGTEHEKFGFHVSDLSPVAYEGPGGIRALLDGMVRHFGWTPVLEGQNVIALKRGPGEPGGNISLEPGGQFELSGAPVSSIHETAAEMAEHVRQVKLVGDELGIGFLGLGFSPKWTRAQTPKMPKGRYGIMTAYMPKVGSLGLDMMYRSCTVQTNLDFASEADMVKKLRVSLALQPVVAAIFADDVIDGGEAFAGLGALLEGGLVVAAVLVGGGGFDGVHQRGTDDAAGSANAAVKVDGGDQGFEGIREG